MVHDYKPNHEAREKNIHFRLLIKGYQESRKYPLLPVSIGFQTFMCKTSSKHLTYGYIQNLTFLVCG